MSQTLKRRLKCPKLWDVWNVFSYRRDLCFAWGTSLMRHIYLIRNHLNVAHCTVTVLLLPPPTGHAREVEVPAEPLAALRTGGKMNEEAVEMIDMREHARQCQFLSFRFTRWSSGCSVWPSATSSRPWSRAGYSTEATPPCTTEWGTRGTCGGSCSGPSYSSTR